MKIARRKITVHQDAVVREAIEQMTAARSGIVIVENDDGALLGVLADGDIRRALLNGLDLTSPVARVVNRDPVVASVHMSERERRELVNSRHHMVPVIDDEGCVVDCLWYDGDGGNLFDVRGSTVAVHGLGFVGLTLALSLADVGLQVLGLDPDPEVAGPLRLGESHFHEAGIQRYLNQHLGTRLDVRNEVGDAKCDVHVVAVGTPIDRPCGSPSLDAVRSAARSVGGVLEPGNLVILRSTVPVGTTREEVLPLLEGESGLNAGDDFRLVFAPERTVAGNALKEIGSLPQIIGGYDQMSFYMASRLFSLLTRTVIDVGSLEAAEMAKILDNSYRDVKFAYANEMAVLCEELDLDMTELAQSVNLGYTRNQIPVPSPGVGGYCLSKDPYILLDIGKKAGVDLELIRAARGRNESMPHRVASKLFGLLAEAGKKPSESSVLVLGFAFKGRPETSDMRESPTLPLVEDLLDAGVQVFGYDPVVPKDRIRELGVETTDIERGFSGSDGVVIMTNHPEFEQLNVFELLPEMALPGVFIDGWSLLDPEDVRSVPGVYYGGVGRT